MLDKNKNPGKAFAAKKNLHKKNPDTQIIAIPEFLTSDNAERLIAAYSALDTAVKKHVIHRNKADRLKSALAKMLKKTDSQSEKQPVKPKKRLQRSPSSAKA